MQVIFLDLDGVANSESSFTWHRLTNETNENYRISNPNPMSVVFIDYLVYVTGAKIVISSSWRENTVDGIKATLKKEFDLTRIDSVIDQTPRLWDNAKRGYEIKQWLDKNPVDGYIIIDDETDMLPEQIPFIVQTDFYNGFSSRDLYKAIELLGCTKEENEVHNNESLIQAFRDGKNYFKD